MELEIDAEWNRIEAAGRVTSSVGEIRPRGGSSNSRRRSGIERRAKALLTGEEAVRPSLVVPTATSTPPRGGSSSSASSPMDRPCSSSVGSSAPPDQARKLSRRRSLRAACPRARSPACPPSGVVEVAGVEGVRESGGGERRSAWLKIPQECASGGPCRILQLPLRQPLEPLHWLQHPQNPVAAPVAETAGDNL
jgi:hypothetical protein